MLLSDLGHPHRARSILFPNPTAMDDRDPQVPDLHFGTGETNGPHGVDGIALWLLPDERASLDVSTIMDPDRTFQGPCFVLRQIDGDVLTWRTYDLTGEPHDPDDTLSLWEVLMIAIRDERVIPLARGKNQ